MNSSVLMRSVRALGWRRGAQLLQGTSRTPIRSVRTQATAPSPSTTSKLFSSRTAAMLAGVATTTAAVAVACLGPDGLGAAQSTVFVRFAEASQASSLPPHSTTKDQVDDGDYIIEPISKTKVPKTMRIRHGSDAATEEFELLGFGVRQVTFLRVTVYVAAIYGNPALARHITGSSRWRQEFAANKLSQQEHGDGKWFVEDLVNCRDGAAMALRIEPTRNTDGPHLRNGFVRFLTARQQKEDMTSTSSSQSSAREVFAEGLQTLRAQFPSGVVRKGDALVLLLEGSDRDHGKDGATLSVHLEHAAGSSASSSVIDMTDEPAAGKKVAGTVAKWALAGFVRGDVPLIGGLRPGVRLAEIARSASP